MYLCLYIINLITNSKMKTFIFIVTLLFTSVVSYSQILESEWKFEKDFEKEFAGKYYIDDNGNKVYPEEWNESIIDLKTKILETILKKKLRKLSLD